LALLIGAGVKGNGYEIIDALTDLKLFRASNEPSNDRCTDIFLQKEPARNNLKSVSASSSHTYEKNDQKSHQKSHQKIR